MNKNRNDARETDDFKKDKPSNRGRRSRGRSGRNSKPEKPSEVTTLSNDPSWYFSDPTLIDQAAAFSFAQFAGLPIDFGNCRTKDWSILVMKYSPTPTRSFSDISGTDGYALSGLNYSTRKWYTWLSSKTGRTSSYSPEDIGIMLLAMGELLSYVSFLRMAFGLIWTTNVRNRNFPDGILRALEIDPDDLRQNIAQYRMLFNTLIVSMNKIPIPIDVPYLAKCSHMYDNVYQDQPSSMGQIYVMKPYTTWTIEEVSPEPGGSYLKTTAIPTTYTSDPTKMSHMSDHLAVLATMIERLFTSTTLNVVYQDMLNLASSVNINFALFGLLTEDYSVVPVYDPLKLLQIHNTHIVGVPVSAAKTGYTKSNDVTTDTDYLTIQYNPLYSVSGANIPDAAVARGFTLVDMLTSNPGPVDRIDGTRYVIAPTGKISIAGDTATYTQFTTGDHSCNQITLCEMNNGGVIGSTNLRNSFITRNYSDTYPFANVAEGMSRFDWAPIQIVPRGNSAGDAIESMHVLGDLNFYTTVLESKLRTMNRMAEQHLFDLPVNRDKF